MDTNTKQNPPAQAAGNIGRKILFLAAIIVCGLFQSCAAPQKTTHLAANTTSTDDRGFEGGAKRFERPPPFGSRFNDD